MKLNLEIIKAVKEGDVAKFERLFKSQKTNENLCIETDHDLCGSSCDVCIMWSTVRETIKVLEEVSNEESKNS